MGSGLPIIISFAQKAHAASVIGRIAMAVGTQFKKVLAEIKAQAWDSKAWAEHEPSNTPCSDSE